MDMEARTKRNMVVISSWSAAVAPPFWEFFYPHLPHDGNHPIMNSLQG
jgi:hypothetical protein